MFNSTHTLVGIALSRAGLNRWSPHATATAVVATNFPDLDSFTLFADSAVYLEHHRGITHSVLAIPFLAAFVAAVVWAVTSRGPTPPTGFRALFGIALVVMMTHPLLDYLNPYGLRPFLPFETTWLYGDTVFIIDPWIDFLLLAGILAPRWVPRRPAVMAGLSIAIVTGYLGLRMGTRVQAVDRLDAYVETTAGATSSAVLPRMLNPFVWTGIVESEANLWRVEIAGGQVRPDFEIDKMPDSLVTERAAQSATAATLLGFARFPFYVEQQLDDGYRVYFADFRFFNQLTALASAVTLDADLNIVGEEWGFNTALELE